MISTMKAFDSLLWQHKNSALLCLLGMSVWASTSFELFSLIRSQSYQKQNWRCIITRRRLYMKWKGFIEVWRNKVWSLHDPYKTFQKSPEMEHPNVLHVHCAPDSSTLVRSIGKTSEAPETQRLAFSLVGLSFFRFTIRVCCVVVF